MKKAVIAVGGKQYLVTEGQELLVEKQADAQALRFEPYLIIDEGTVLIGEPTVAGGAVTANVLEAEVKAAKVQVLKFQSKKRVRNLKGHRQTHTKIKIDKITAK